MDRALIRQKWVLGDRWNRIGHPFVWVDGKQQKSSAPFLDGPYAVLQALSIYYEHYPTVDAARTDDHEAVSADLKSQILDFLHHMGMDGLVDDYRNYIDVTALTRAQDYSFIKRYATDLAAHPAHLDIGPGMGSHAIYSLLHLDSGYTGLEASDFYYNVQRHTYRYLATKSVTYYDPIIDETLGVGPDIIDMKLRNAGARGRLTHLPSWYAASLASNSHDLITATFMLNEVSPSGIAWLLSHANRVLKVGGYIYIRDSERLKPNRHKLNYDSVLREMGYVQIQRLDVKNRVDMFGIPRLYQKMESREISFDEMFEKHFGHFAMTALLGEYMQNI